MNSIQRPLAFTLLAFVWAVSSAQGQDATQRTAFMREARWGVMTHYLKDWISRNESMQIDVDKWTALADHFDAKGLANKTKSPGAGYHTLPIGQNSGYYVAPNATYDR